MDRMTGRGKDILLMPKGLESMRRVGRRSICMGSIKKGALSDVSVGSRKMWEGGKRERFPLFLLYRVRQKEKLYALVIIAWKCYNLFDYVRELI